MASIDPKESEYLSELNDIISRYELTLPISTEQLLDELITLDNPYDVIQYFAKMHAWVAQHHSDAIAQGAMPKISLVHAAIPRPNLGGLSYKELESTLSDMNTDTKTPVDELGLCLARTDMVPFLEYIRDNNPTLTKTLRQINRKSIAEINALMAEPQQAVHDYGTVVFTDRDEREFWHIGFLRSLSQAEYMIYVRKNRLNLSKRGTAWLKLDGAAQTKSLFRIWCEVANWSYWSDYFQDVSDLLRLEQHMIYQAMLTLDKKLGIIAPQSLDNICAVLCGADNSPREFGGRPFDHVSYNMIIRPFIYFGLATYVHPQKDYLSKHDIALTNLGRWLLKTAMRERWSPINKK